ncbi:acyl-CoA dehydrogenase family protein [Bradyrhizobium sp. GCM10023182]|uniref:Acyl-CoA dehydrogenase family protein n=1 Tax=Bradyrhizobium zhengyangense TaxID=2911009 RepID=A0ABS9M2A4_9BRAD|nr:acyl-CoA dehydrogenase family protein [Bradyrhizobium zhengyangense]MCG2673395.1 acyl-CoA dehydrogenase family protein [Bradyrhizobium zhengyangense]
MPRFETSARRRLAEFAEDLLKDPRDAENPLSFAYASKIDESERFPKEAIAWLYEQGFGRQFVPEQLGGSFKSFPVLAELIRTLSRRDLTSSISFSTLFWSFLTWIAGTDEQKRWLADYIMRQNGAMCLAYSEKHHGSDLLASETSASRIPGGFEITGEKWPINRATIGELCFLLATTDPSAGPRGLSLFMIDKRRLNAKEFSNLPKVPTLGIRGSDISGLRFERCRIDADNLLGEIGMGLEIGLKGFQITRALCAAFSLGAGDTALRTTVEFALGRRLYNERVVDMPHASLVLTNAFLDLLICDCVAVSCLRAFHLVPEQASIWSAVAKYFVPTTIERMIGDLSVILSARYYMREEHEWGVFQRIQRDCSIVSVFDGNTVVNLHNIILQLRTLARRRQKGADDLDVLKRVFDYHGPLPRFEPGRLSLVSTKGNSALDCIETTLQHLEMTGDAGIDHKELNRIRSIANVLREEIEEYQAEFSQSEFEHGHLQSAKAFQSAKRYCELHAAAACLHTWVWQTGTDRSFFSEGRWLVPALARILSAHLGQSEINTAQEPDASLLAELLRRHREKEAFSISASALA